MGFNFHRIQIPPAMGVSRTNEYTGACPCGVSTEQQPLSSRMPGTESRPDASQTGFHRQRPFLWTWLRLAVIMCLTGFVLRSAGTARAAEIAAEEHQVKAAYVFRLGFFTEWPTNRFSTAESPLVIGVIGNEPVARALEKIAVTGKINEHKLVIKRMKPEENLSVCHILFIGEGQNYEPILGKVEQASVLTIGDQENFAKNGGGFNLVQIGERIKFRANRAAIITANLKVKAQVLRIAIEVFETIRPSMGGRP